jgi:hypothetical protein
LLASHSTPKLDGHPLLVGCHHLFSVLAATLQIWGPYPPSAKREDMPRQGEMDLDNMVLEKLAKIFS